MKNIVFCRDSPEIKAFIRRFLPYCPFLVYFFSYNDGGMRPNIYLFLWVNILNNQNMFVIPEEGDGQLIGSSYGLTFTGRG